MKAFHPSLINAERISHRYYELATNQSITGEWQLGKKLVDITFDNVVFEMRDCEGTWQVTIRSEKKFRQAVAFSVVNLDNLLGNKDYPVHPDIRKKLFYQTLLCFSRVVVAEYRAYKINRVCNTPEPTIS